MEPALSSAPLGRIERSVLVDDVYERLKAWIMDDVREAGVRANIDALARSLAVSPTPVREALVRLEAEGFVAKAPARGYTVTPPLTEGEIADLYEFRELIEPWAAGRAAALADRDDVAALRAELASCPAAPADDGYATYRAIAEHDERFHDLVLALAGNEQVRRSFAHTHCHLHLFRVTYGTGMGSEALAEHAAVVEAIASADADAAARAMRDHLRRSAARLARADRVADPLAGPGS